METKKWWQSKAIWTGVLIVVFALYDAFAVAGALAFNIHVPAIPEWVFAILGSFGIVFRKTATTVIQ